MKKIILATLAIAALAACTKTEVVSVTESNAIAFDNAFVDNATKSVNDPSFTNDNLFTDFAVYGFVEGAVLFNGIQVSKTIDNNDLSSVWKYEGTQYWIAGAKYNFAAVAPMENGNWEKKTASKDGVSLSFTNNGSTDLLYAQTDEIEGKVSENSDVEFTFRHILSKVKFSFKNEYNATNATIRVKNIKITNPHKTATVVLTAATAWDGHASAADFELSFGMATDDEDTADKEKVEVAYAFGKTYESQNELFLIPSASYPYKVTFDVELLVSGQLIDTYEHTVTATFAPVAGNSYDIKAVINASNIDPNHAQEPIEFTVSTLSGWTTAAGVDAQYPQNN